MVKALLDDFRRLPIGNPFEVILTVNVPEPLGFVVSEFPFPILVLENSTPLGFSANHNQAFARSGGQFFCVLNPDIRLEQDPFPVLLASLSDMSIGVVAPLVLNAQGTVEDSARPFPTPLHVFCKAIGACKGSYYSAGSEAFFPDWVAGMFLLFPRQVYELLGGFDQRYFLYYEDVDICARLRLLGYRVMLNPLAKVIHHAQRSSHRNTKYLSWHLQSMLRFFLSAVFLRIQWKKLLKGAA